MTKSNNRFRLQAQPILVAGTLETFLNLFREAQREFEAVGGQGISFKDLTFYAREKRNEFSPRQLVEMWQYFKNQGFLEAAHEV